MTRIKLFACWKILRSTILINFADTDPNQMIFPQKHLQSCLTTEYWGVVSGLGWKMTTCFGPNTSFSRVAKWKTHDVMYLHMGRESLKSHSPHKMIYIYKYQYTSIYIQLYRIPFLNPKKYAYKDYCIVHFTKLWRYSEGKPTLSLSGIRVWMYSHGVTLTLSSHPVCMVKLQFVWPAKNQLGMSQDDSHDKKNNIYSLVNVYIPIERSTIFNWKITIISTGPFWVNMWVITRGY